MDSEGEEYTRVLRVALRGIRKADSFRTLHSYCLATHCARIYIYIPDKGLLSALTQMAGYALRHPYSLKKDRHMRVGAPVEAFLELKQVYPT